MPQPARTAPSASALLGQPLGDEDDHTAVGDLQQSFRRRRPATLGCFVTARSLAAERPASVCAFGLASRREVDLADRAQVPLIESNGRRTPPRRDRNRRPDGSSASVSRPTQAAAPGPGPPAPASSSRAPPRADTCRTARRSGHRGRRRVIRRRRPPVPHRRLAPELGDRRASQDALPRVELASVADVDALDLCLDRRTVEVDSITLRTIADVEPFSRPIAGEIVWPHRVPEWPSRAPPHPARASGRRSALRVEDAPLRRLHR